MNCLKTDFILGLLIMPIKAVAETDQENKNEAESTIENDYVEQGIKRKCSVHSEFTEIPYS